MRLEDFHYDLPDELIARYPLATRSASRLLCVNANTQTLTHRHFYQLLDLVEPGDLLVFNNTKVIPARLFGRKATGGLVEVLIERILDDKHALAQIRSSKSPKIGSTIYFTETIGLTVIDKQDQFYQLQFNGSETLLDVIEAIGQIPLPPYMHRLPDENDWARYQTIYALNKGSVAAPTAGLHFDDELMQQLKAKSVEMAYLTLHIGAGTFLPVRVNNIAEHKMHAEYLEVSEALCEKILATKKAGKRVIAVGTTSLRALETASQHGNIAPYQGDTRIFIYPGYQFRCVDVLVTNLHLPGSTLLMLVTAFGGYEKIMQAYQAAVKEGYRFYSYGDAMWVEQNTRHCEEDEVRRSNPFFKGPTNDFDGISH